MQKKEKISWKDTNLALIGSELDHKVKEAAAHGEEAWEGIGKQPGLFVWRIEQFTVKPWPREQYGQFFQGDSYIVLNSYGSDPNNLQHDLHIWIGSESTQDEYGTAAYKMVEADDFLGGAAVQHRQVEGMEAPDFVDCFDALEYLEGGVDSGFRKVTPTKEKPLFYKFRIRDEKRRKGELVQVPMSVDSMDSKSGFILYADKATVWAWHGKEMKLLEKIACTNQGEKLCTLGTVTVLAQGEDDDEDEDFWNYLTRGMSEGDRNASSRRSSSLAIGSTPRSRKDRAFVSNNVKEFRPKWFVVDCNDPTIPLKQIGLGDLIKKAIRNRPNLAGFFKKQNTSSSSTLDDNNVYLVDTGWQIFVWVGKNADRGEKVAALGAADQYAVIDPRAKELPVTVLKSGQERDGFLSFFK